jgi:chemotaxis signal transduction protein
LLEPPPVTLGEREAAFVTATLRYRQRLIGVLHLERLVAIESPAAVRPVV